MSQQSKQSGRPGRKRLDSRPKCDTCKQGGDSHGKKKIMATLHGFICTDCQRKQDANNS